MTGKALLLSIKPRYADSIFERTKRVELRRVRPKLSAGDLVLIYVTSPRCSLEGAFEVERVIEAKPAVLWRHVEHNAGLSHEEFTWYYTGSAMAYGIVIRRVWRFAPLSLSALRKAKIRPPQSYHYLDAALTSSLKLRRNA